MGKVEGKIIADVKRQILGRSEMNALGVAVKSCRLEVMGTGASEGTETLRLESTWNCGRCALCHNKQMSNEALEG